jgi:hypothetical protein
MRFRWRSTVPLKNSTFAAFPSGTNSLCTTLWESNKIIKFVLTRDLWNFSSFSRRDVLPNHPLCFGSYAKHQVSSFVIILLNICQHRDNILVRWDSIFLLFRCQEMWNKTWTYLPLTKILFQNPKNYSVENVQRFCYHSGCDSTVIFVQMSNRNNVYLSSTRFWTATYLVTCYQFLPFWNRECHVKTFDRFRASFP